MRAAFGVTAVGFYDLFQLIHVAQYIVRRYVNSHEKVIKFVSSLSPDGQSYSTWVKFSSGKTEDAYKAKLPDGLGKGEARDWQKALRSMVTMFFVSGGWTVTDEYEDDAHVSVRFGRE